MITKLRKRYLLFYSVIVFGVMTLLLGGAILLPNTIDHFRNVAILTDSIKINLENNDLQLAEINRIMIDAENKIIFEYLPMHILCIVFPIIIIIIGYILLKDENEMNHLEENKIESPS